MAGSEAAWHLAEQGVDVDLYEMRPQTMTPAHSTGLLGELVCSNSLKSEDLSNAAGLLKAEMRLMGSLVMEAAEAARVPAGSALAVDRHEFAEFITARLQSHPRINLIRQEVTQLHPNDGLVTVVATGPLTSQPLSDFLMRLTGGEHLYFTTSGSIVSADSLDMGKLFGVSLGQGRR